MKNKKCPLCASKAIAKKQDYHSGRYDSSSGKEIVVRDVFTLHCQNEECAHSWLPIDQERIIDKEIAARTRFDLTPNQITTVRESLPFSSKFQTAEFLCLNEKAFTKWELGYSEPNRAYDLLMRMAVHSWDNFNFIQHLHRSNFAFDMRDYQILCDKYNLKWNFEILARPGMDQQQNLAASLEGEITTEENQTFVESTPSNQNTSATAEGTLAA